MANVIRGQNNGSITDLLYCRDDRAVSRYAEQSRERLSRYSEKFVAQVTELRERVRDNYVTRRAIGAYRKLRNAGRPNAVSQLIDVGAMQHAMPIMRRIIMASPITRGMYNRRQLEGYADEWEPDNRNAIRDTDITYRQIYNGVTTFDNGNKASTYVMCEADDEFDWIDRADARITIDEVARIIEKGDDDPTSRFNAGLSKI